MRTLHIIKKIDIEVHSGELEKTWKFTFDEQKRTNGRSLAIASA